MASWIDWAKTKLLVEQATSHNDDPTPIYVLDEVVAALAGGDSRAGVDAVIARLGHRSPIVKQKALKLVAHIGRKGSPDLRRLLSRQSGAVRELQHFRCDPDPFTGDAVWRRVQESAQDALNAIHAAPEAAAAPHSILGARIQGFGSDAGGGGGGRRGFGSDAVGGSGGSGGSGGGSGRMVGFGSADAVQSGMQAVSSGMRSLGGKAGGLLRQDGYSSSQLDGGSSYSGSTSRQGAALTQPIMQTGGPPLAAASSNSAGLAAAAGGGRPLGGGGGSASAAAAEAAPEAKLVDRLCAPAGLRAAPSREDLQAFVAAVSALDGLAVARLLEQKLEAAAPWQSTLRALCAIEAVVEGGSSTACGQLAVHFQTRPGAVAKAAESPQASVRQRAQKLLALLAGDGGAGSGGGGTGAAGTALQQQQQQQQQEPLFTEDLLGEAEPAAGLGDLLHDLAGPSPAPPSATSTAAAAAPTAATPVDLMAGLCMAASTGPAPAVVVQQSEGALGGNPAAADPFAGMLLTGEASAAQGGTAGQAAPSLSPQPPAASPLDLLGGLSFQAAPGAAAPRMAAPQAAFAAAPQQEGDLGDLLGGLSVGPAQPAGVPLGSGFRHQPMQQPMQRPMQQQPMQQPSYQPFDGGIASGALPSQGLGLQQQSPMHMPLSGPFSGQAAMLGQQQQAAGYQPHGLWSSGSGSSLGHGSTAAFGTPASAVQQHAGMGRLGSSNGVQHGRQASGGGDALCKLSSSGIVDTPNSFNFVDDAIAAARRKQ